MVLDLIFWLEDFFVVASGEPRRIGDQRHLLRSPRYVAFSSSTRCSDAFLLLGTVGIVRSDEFTPKDTFKHVSNPSRTE